MVFKICRYDGGVCRLEFCSWLDCCGNVITCNRLLCPKAFHVRRLVKPANVSIHDLWRGKRRC